MYMEFYRERVIKKPKKKYKCRFCGNEITEKHMYVSAKGDDFFTLRAHTDCYEKAVQMCSDCEESGDCYVDWRECFIESNRRL